MRSGGTISPASTRRCPSTRTRRGACRSRSRDARSWSASSPAHRAAFQATPAKYEPQYGGFCSNGAPYAVKLGSDPTQFEIRGGRLFIFGDIQGHEMWLLDWHDNIRHGDELWPSIKDRGWR